MQQVFVVALLSLDGQEGLLQHSWDIKILIRQLNTVKLKNRHETGSNLSLATRLHCKSTSKIEGFSRASTKTPKLNVTSQSSSFKINSSNGSFKTAFFRTAIFKFYLPSTIFILFSSNNSISKYKKLVDFEHFWNQKVLPPKTWQNESFFW